MYEKDADAWRFGTSEAETEEKSGKCWSMPERPAHSIETSAKEPSCRIFPVVNKETIRSHYDDFFLRTLQKQRNAAAEYERIDRDPITIYQDLTKQTMTRRTDILGALAGYYIGQKMALSASNHNIVKSRLELLAENFIMMDGSHLDDVS